MIIEGIYNISLYGIFINGLVDWIVASCVLRKRDSL
jgi:hypothetical protein